MSQQQKVYKVYNLIEKSIYKSKEKKYMDRDQPHLDSPIDPSPIPKYPKQTGN
jgi:hypothetical protein